MRKVILSSFVSVDGVAETPEKWQEPYWSDELEAYSYDLLHSVDALLLGRVTYEIFAEAWPAITDESGFAERMNTLPKYVATTTLTELSWNATPVRSVAELERLKQGPGGDLLIYGSTGLVRNLIRSGLIDDYRIWVHPVIVGAGARMFIADGPGAGLKLVAATVFDTGVVIQRYRPANG